MSPEDKEYIEREIEKRAQLGKWSPKEVDNFRRQLEAIIDGMNPFAPVPRTEEA
jgi:hypothetical protein